MRSAARLETKQPEPFIYFLDRGLGRNVIAGALRGKGRRVEIHDDHFAIDTPDETWLRACAARHWVAITKDAATRMNELQTVAASGAGIAAFVLGNANATGDQMAEAIIAALPSIERILHRFALPIIATVTLNAGVAVRRAGTQTFDPPKYFKPFGA